MLTAQKNGDWWVSVVAAAVEWMGMAMLKTAWCGTKTPDCLGASHFPARHPSYPFGRLLFYLRWV
jgi:hypothetical protein